MKRILITLLALLLLFVNAGLADVLPVTGEILVDGDYVLTDDFDLEYGMDYSTPEEVALYLYVFCELPPNYLTKSEARSLGWVSSEGNLWDVTDEMSIGGDVFGNREGLLPDEPGRTWYECDANYRGKKRGAQRVLFSSDGLYYYTDDHYQTFTEMFPEDLQ